LGTYYQQLDHPAFDYELFAMSSFPGRTFRGPPADIAQPFAVCIGAAQTFGRFTKSPFPQILSERLKLPFLNLAVGGVGPRHYDDDAYLQTINRAEAVVIQVLSGRSASNSLFDNREKGDLFGRRISDGKVMRFEEFYDDLCATSPELIESIIKETQQDYVNSFIHLLSRIHVPKILLWMSDRDPAVEYPSYRLNSFPQFVTKGMFEDLCPYADESVAIVSQTGVPQQLWQTADVIDGTTLEDGWLYNYYYPTPQMHAEAANLLEPVCRRLTGRERPRPTVKNRRSCRFVILGPERTGSHLLLGMLASHPSCSVGDELFNEDYVTRREIPWEIGSAVDLESLNQLRSDNPIEFVEKLFVIAEDAGKKATGFKIMYGHVERVPAIRDYILFNKDISVIHMRRRNLLERYVSEQRARSTGVWWVSADGRTDPNAKEENAKSIVVELEKLIPDILAKESFFRKYDALLAEHEVLNVYYENLAATPEIVGMRALRFLDLTPHPDIRIDYRKADPRPMSEVVENHHEIKSRLRYWSSF
jgi:LPS sulfotransferase NodH